MPLNEASSKPVRERWPLEFDITGVPRDTKIRKGLIAQKEHEMAQVTNSFAVDKPVAITDINNPPHQNYNPHDPKNEYPKMLYHHESGRVVTVANEKEQKAALKRGYDPKPSAHHDYSKVNRAGIAAVAATAEREEPITAEDLEEE